MDSSSTEALIWRYFIFYRIFLAFAFYSFIFSFSKYSSLLLQFIVGKILVLFAKLYRQYDSVSKIFFGTWQKRLKHSKRCGPTDMRDNFCIAHITTPNVAACKKQTWIELQVWSYEGLEDRSHRSQMPTRRRWAASHSGSSLVENALSRTMLHFYKNIVQVTLFWDS